MTLKTLTNSGNRKQWLKDRKRFIGASEVASLMGDNPWRSILDLWREKLSEEIDWTDNERMRLGRILEPTVLRLAADWLAEKSETDWRIEMNSDTVMREDIPGLAVTVDGWGYPAGASSDYEPVIVEAKVTADTNESHWLHDGVPKWYWWQLQAQMLVFERPYAYIACLFGGLRFDVWKVPADTEAQEQLRERLGRFYSDLQAARKSGDHQPPAWIVELADEEARRNYELAKARQSKLVQLAEDADNLISELDTLKAEKSRLDKRIKALEARILEALGDADTGETPSGRKVSVKTINLPERTLAATSFKRLYVGKSKRK